MKAFQKLEQLRGGFPVDFDPDKELAEAREAKYADTKVIMPSEFCKLVGK